MENYYKTSRRTALSSNILHSNGEFFNSCYLAGYVLECYTKLLLKKALNLTDEDLKKEFSHDIKKLNKTITILKEDPSAYGLLDTSYLIDLTSTCSRMISGTNRWDPNKRYDADETIWNSLVSQEYQCSVSIIMAEINKMKLDGVII
ncbi:MAG: hypothetical protein JXR64_03525 [Spirochaetales bacterium]|nr:hypothetical protein [Spirochaetales bacterium]